MPEKAFERISGSQGDLPGGRINDQEYTKIIPPDE
jgi:hypothetical protein